MPNGLLPDFHRIGPAKLELIWTTNLTAAIAEARRTNRPILSLHLLGRLDQELSCANSRFFRKLLYVDPTIHRILRDHFVLHWHSVRAVPIVTIDFGNGKKMTKTLTGNSAHLVLDREGRIVDALPGLFSREVFAQLLVRAHAIAVAVTTNGRRHLAAMHRRELDQPVRPTRRAPQPRALAASMVAMTKHVVEGPILRGVSLDVEHDTETNLGLHAQVHQLLATGVEWTPAQMVDWLYRELFLMPPDDPFMGLDVPEPF
jgi:hypothetical protein